MQNESTFLSYPDEAWKDIKEYEGYYQVSNYGRVKSLERLIIHSNGFKQRLKSSLRKPAKNNGYLGVILYKNQKKRRFYVHRLVAEAFIPNPNNYPQVNHKDEDKTNNHVSNLEWCDQKYNMDYGTVRKRQAESISKPVLQFTKDGEFVTEYSSGIEVERIHGYSHSNISACCLGKYKSAYGYVWKYKD